MPEDAGGAGLGQSLRVVRPDVPGALVSPPVLERVARLADTLPPVHCAGFECRLGAGDGRVDFQQRIVPARGEHRVLARHVAREGLDRLPAWRRVAALCATLDDAGSPLHGSVDGLWLEFDLDAAGERDPPPSVFVSLGRAEPAARAATARAVLEALHPAPLPDGVLADLHACVSACPQGAGVSDVGVLLGREPVVARVTIAPLAGADAEALAGRLGTDASAHAGDAGAVLPDDLAARQKLLLSADLGAGPRAALALEAFPGGNPEAQPEAEDHDAWRTLLDRLVAARLCTPEKRAALLAWTGQRDPLDAPAPWPDALVAASLLRPADTFAVIGRRLSHVKLARGGDGAVTAKAYFGFGYLWLRPQHTGAAAAPGQATEHGAASALAGAIAHLVAAQRADGAWRDFEALEGGSDEWVTGYVGAALAAQPDPAGRAAARAAWAWLAPRARADGGWGFHDRTPPDADSTAWALRLAAALGEDASPAARRARAFLARHRRPGGGVASYRDPEALGRFLGAPAGTDFSGWTASHTCVTAACAGLADVSGYLRETQRRDGAWAGYWWCDDAYATALAAEALARTAPGDGDDAKTALDAALAWAAETPADAGAFALACRLRVLRLAPAFGATRRALRERLIAAQRADGGFAGTARLRIPAPAGGGTPSVLVDDRGLFTTATALAALAAGPATHALRIHHTAVPEPTGP